MFLCQLRCKVGVVAPRSLKLFTMGDQLVGFQAYLRRLEKVVVLVGAGLLECLGLAPKNWKNYHQIDVATPEAFYIDPGLVWQYHLWRRYRALEVTPNAGHRAIASLAQRGKQVITIDQGVDGLLARAGHPMSSLYDINGLVLALRCTSFMCNYVDRYNTSQPLTPALESTEAEFEAGTRKRHREESPALLPQFAPVLQLEELELPQCPICQLLLRPGVVWFGETLDRRHLHAIDLFIEDGSPPDLLIVVGAPVTSHPVSLYVDRVRHHGGKVAIFNAEVGDDIIAGSEANTWGFRGNCAELLAEALAPPPVAS